MGHDPLKLTGGPLQESPPPLQYMLYHLHSAFTDSGPGGDEGRIALQVGKVDQVKYQESQSTGCRTTGGSRGAQLLTGWDQTPPRLVTPGISSFIRVFGPVGDRY